MKFNRSSSVAAAIAAGAIALSAPLAGFAATASAQDSAATSYAPTFGTFRNNVTHYAENLQEVANTKLSDAQLTEIFGIKFENGQAVDDSTYVPTFGGAKDGNSVDEIKYFNARIADAQVLTPEQINANLGAIYGENVNVQAIEETGANVNPNGNAEQVPDTQPPAPEVNDNSADSGTAGANEPTWEEIPDTAADETVEAQTPAPQTDNTAPASTGTAQLANTGVNDIAALAGGGVLAGVLGGMTLLRRNK